MSENERAAGVAISASLILVSPHTHLSDEAEEHLDDEQASVGIADAAKTKQQPSVDTDSTWESSDEDEKSDSVKPSKIEEQQLDESFHKLSDCERQDIGKPYDSASEHMGGASNRLRAECKQAERTNSNPINESSGNIEQSNSKLKHARQQSQQVPSGTSLKRDMKSEMQTVEQVRPNNKHPMRVAEEVCKLERELHDGEEICKTSFKFNSSLPDPSQLNIDSHENSGANNNNNNAKSAHIRSQPTAEVISSKPTPDPTIRNTGNQDISSSELNSRNLSHFSPANDKSHSIKEQQVRNMTSVALRSRERRPMDQVDSEILNIIGHNRLKKQDESSENTSLVKSQNNDETAENRLSTLR